MTIQTSALTLIDGDELVDMVDNRDIHTMTKGPFGHPIVAVEHGHRKAFVKIVTEGGTVHVKRRALVLVNPQQKKEQ